VSKESAAQFLKDATWDVDLREQFNAVAKPEEFIKVASQLGYTFTTEELKAVVHEHSQGIQTRRSTGIWSWLRRVNWI